VNVAHEKLAGLDRERVLAAVTPVLAAHGLDAVEIVWRTDRGGWLLEVTVERPGTRLPGEGITVELCSEVSRDLSTALDVADCIAHRYRLEVGSPGLERALYSLEDYRRFAGQFARLKLSEPHAGQYVVYGILQGVDAEGGVAVQAENGEILSLAPGRIGEARLAFRMEGRGPRPGSGHKQHGSGREQRAPRAQRTGR
jgi:ribosome maturation factor RimP